MCNAEEILTFLSFCCQHIVNTLSLCHCLTQKSATLLRVVHIVVAQT